MLRAEIAESRMPPLTVVPHFNVLENRLSGVLTGCVAVDHTFGLECCEKALHHGIVIAVASPTHANFNPIFMKQVQVIVTGILATLIAVVDQLASDDPPP